MTPLSHERIARQALQMIDEGGINGLSMRKLGQALGVDAKAVYYYFPNKEAVIIGALQIALETLSFQESTEQSWQAQLTTIARSYHQAVSQHPNLMPYFVALDGSIPTVFSVIERIVHALQPTGLSARSIAQIVDLLTGFVPDFALSTQGDTEHLYDRIKGLSPEHFPTTTRLIRMLAPDDLEEDFDFQLNILLMGIEAQIRRETEQSNS